MVTLSWLKDSNLRRGATLFGSWDRRCTCVTIFVVRGWNRTTGTRRFKSLLYLLSYRTIFEVKNSSVLPHVWYPFIECFITGSCYHSFLKGTTQLEIVLEYPSRSNLNCLIVVLRGLGRKGDEFRFHSGLSTSVEWGKPLSKSLLFQRTYL